MATTLHDYLQKYAHTPYEDLLILAKKNTTLLWDELEKMFEDCDSVTVSDVYLHVISACLGTDGNFSEKEYKFFCDFLGRDGSGEDYEDMKNVITLIGDDAGREAADTLIDSLSDKGKAQLTMFCIAFLCADKDVTHEESGFLKKLLA